MATQIQLRRGTAADWTTAAPTLTSGEVGFETDTGKFKIGDGSTAWASLSYYDIVQTIASGSFTPTVTFGTVGDFTPTYNTQTGVYWRHGDFLHFSLDLDFDTNAYTTAAGDLIIGGLPVAVASGITNNALSLAEIENVTFAAADHIGAAALDTTTTIKIFSSTLSSTSAAITVTEVPASTSGVHFSISGSYKV